MTSPFYRICPGCGIGHMVTHKGRDYCTDKCADLYYNAHRKNLKQAAAIVAQMGYQVPGSSEHLSGTMQPDDAYKKYLNDELKQNVQFLNGLKLNPGGSARYLQSHFVDSRFNFSVFSKSQKVYNTTEDEQSYFITIANFDLFLLSENEILIKKNKLNGKPGTDQNIRNTTE